MPTTRSSRRTGNSQPSKATGTKRASDNAAHAKPSKREKRSNDEKERKGASDNDNIKGTGSEQASTEITEGKESANKKDENKGEVPLSTLEQGIIYFFYRGRVGIEDPQGIEDVARSYIVLRPLDDGAKVGDAPPHDAGNCRLLALPKKMLPKKHGDGFLAFVEKASCSLKDLRKQFSGTEYETKTAGTRHIPAATPFAEGVYSITSIDGQSHLTYQIKLPDIGEVQKELGVHEKARYIVSVKNPEYPGPGGQAPLGNPPSYPKDTQEKFKGLRWIPLIPELLNYDQTQLLVIGETLHPGDKPAEGVAEHEEDELRSATESANDKQGTQAHRCAPDFTQNDPVLADLENISKDYQKLQTTW